MGFRLGIGNVDLRNINPFSWDAYWARNDKILFFGLYSEISGGQMPNKVAGSTDYLTVAGEAGSETYQCPDTVTYIAADTDYIWFKTDETQRTTTTAELIGYDLQRTPVYYGDVSPNAIVAIMILKSGETLTDDENNRLHRDMHLSIFWDGIENDYGYLKDNRVGQQLWTPESVYEDETVAYLARLGTAMTETQEDAINNLIIAAKANGWWTPMGCIRLIHLHNETDAKLNLKSTSFTATDVLTPTFTAYSGLVSDEAGAGWNNNYTPSSAGDMTQNDASFIEYYSNYNVAESNRFAGGHDGTRYINLGHAATTTCQARMNEGSGTFTSLAGGTNGLWGIIRSGAAVKMLLLNATKADDTDASTGLPTQSLYTGCLNNNGSGLYGGSTKIIKATLIGKAISQATFQQIKTDLETFFAAFTA